jgi:predicted RNA-binding protein with PIN domain
MSYLIDGHNLIPNVRGISLQDLDDEIALIKLLQTFARKSRRKVEVFFDKAPEREARTQNYGTIKVHFVRQSITADEAIIQRLYTMEKRAKNWTVVTSDRQIAAVVKAVHATLLSSQEFAKLLQKTLDSAEEMNRQDKALGDAEVAEWLRLFGEE